MAGRKSKVYEAEMAAALEELKLEFEALTTEENQMAKSKAYRLFPKQTGGT